MLSSIDGCMGSIKEVHVLPNSDGRSKPVSDMPHHNHISLCLYAKTRIMNMHARARHELPDEVSMPSNCTIR